MSSAELWSFCLGFDVLTTNITENKKVVNLTTLLLLVTSSVVIMTTYGATSDNKDITLTNFFFSDTVYPKKYAHGFCFAVLCCGCTLTDFPISIRLTSLALWQSNDCPSASKATLMNMDKYFMWIHYARLHNHNKAKHNKTVCIFLGIYCMTRAVFTGLFRPCRLHAAARNPQTSPVWTILILTFLKNKWYNNVSFL